MNGAVLISIKSSFLIAMLATLLLSGCATTRSVDFDVSKKDRQPLWMTSILDYKNFADPHHPTHANNLFKVEAGLKELIQHKFQQKNKHKRAAALAQWILDESGLGVEYDLNANLTPKQTLLQRRANCLSYTILLVTLARELDVELQYNDVDIPSSWGQEEETGMVFYRHVNAVYKSPRISQVFDLAMEDYDSAYPQREISSTSAAAMFHSNLAIEALGKGDFDLALHHAKLSVSIDPENTYLWINLGVVTKRMGDLLMAERIFKMSLSLDDLNGLASSNLERLYRVQGRNRLADSFKKRAERARVNNPYVQFDRAKLQFAEANFRKARGHINRAIRLHDLDPRFFELRSKINQHFKRYKPALKDLEKAYELAHDLEERGRYIKKVKQVAKRAEAEAEKRRRRQQQIILVEPSTIYTGNF